MDVPRPSGFPRKDWKNLSHKKKLAIVKGSKGGPKRSAPPTKKWYAEAETSLGNFKAGSGDRSRQRGMRSESMVNAMIDHPQPITINAGPQGRGQVVSQRELVALVNGSLNFQSTSWQLQPGLSSVFAWLSALAKLYQKYHIRKVRLLYKPSVSSFDPLGSKGKCALSFDTDALGTPLSTFIQAEGMTPNARFMPYQDCELDITASIKGDRYVRSGPVPAGSDPKTYDAGTVYFSSDGFGGDGVIGELHCEYEVDLINPILPNSVPAVINLKRSTFNQSNIPLVTGVASKATNLVVSTANGNPLGFNFAGGNFTGVSGQFLWLVTAKFTPAAALIASTILECRLNGLTFANWNDHLNTSVNNQQVVSRHVTFATALSETDVVEVFLVAAFGATTTVGEVIIQVLAL